MQQVYYLDDNREGTLVWGPPRWLGLERDNARYAGSVRWFESAPGTYGFVHRSDVASEPFWQLTLVPVIGVSEYADRMRPLPN